MYTTSDSHWDEHIATAMFSYNISVYESYSPFSLVFGRVPRLLFSTPPAEKYIDNIYHDYLIDLYDSSQKSQKLARKNLIKSKEESKIYYDQKMNPQSLKAGDFVYLQKKGKLSDQYTGPHEVLEILPLNNIKINFKENHG